MIRVARVLLVTLIFAIAGPLVGILGVALYSFAAAAARGPVIWGNALLAPLGLLPIGETFGFVPALCAGLVAGILGIVRPALLTPRAYKLAPLCAAAGLASGFAWSKYVIHAMAAAFSTPPVHSGSSALLLGAIAGATAGVMGLVLPRALWEAP
jgi:hypothetical protein